MFRLQSLWKEKFLHKHISFECKKGFRSKPRFGNFLTFFFFVPFPHYMIIFSLLCINIFFKASWLVVAKKNKNMSVDFLMKIF